MSSQKHIFLIVRTDVSPEMEQEFNQRYNEEHIPLLLKVPKKIRPHLRNFAREIYEI